MKQRRVFSVNDVTAAETAVAAARSAGADDGDVSLIARSDIELRQIHDDRINVESDLVPAALRGAAGGGAMGLLAGLAAITVPAVGITVAGVALLTLAGAAVGSWSSALIGSTVPNPIRRQFEAEIEAGRILVVVDVDTGQLPRIEAALAAAGARELPFEATSALS
ncbi:hypothetical protein [Dokdonella koreensis]|uniref:Transmembrane protein n=1 Tax=Dokdonella koreensis DS-123 TaxID=1300342 RepID=A0A160DXR0_9GAMM|nr:hypothetical protein [Dokdonella koreensis]ANB19529.1 Hypothetical protein I596_3541 [Dokdonella koreensis DS-123]